MAPLVYLDVCCLNRLFDDHRQLRVRLEAEAVREVLRAVAAGRVRWLGSPALELEIARNPNPERRRQAAALAASATERVGLGAEAQARARVLHAAGLGTVDALHWAAAEAGGADVLLTTDDRFERRATRMAPALTPPHAVPVRNPLTWVTEDLNR